jgi:hypothetical protein
MKASAVAGIAAVVAALAAAAPAARAQAAEGQTVRLIGGAGWMSLWDDETMLGRGVLASGGIAMPIGDRLSAEGEISAARHHRDAGYLAAEGTPIFAIGRASYRFGDPSATTRPFASAGFGVIHSTGQFTTRSVVPDDRGFPVEGPSTRRDWSITKPVFELGAGLSIRSAPRVVIRPEFRWIASSGDAASAISTLEPPLAMMRAGVSVEWQMRRGR